MTPLPVDEFRDFLREHLPAFGEEFADPEHWDARCAWQRMLSEGGWAAPAWPTEFGGRGLPAEDVLALVGVLAEHNFGHLPGVLGINYIGPTLMTWGTSEQQSRHLPRILSAEEIWCQGFSEPEAGSDLAGLRTRAVRDGDDYVINGQKLWTTHGMYATHMELLARTDPEAPKHKGLSALIVPMDAQGVERRPIKQIDGREEFAEVFLTEVRVPVANLIGSENDGWKVTMTTLGHERAASAAQTRRLVADTWRMVEREREATLPADLADRVVRCFVESAVLGALGEQLMDELQSGEPGASQAVVKLLFSEAKQRHSATRLALAVRRGDPDVDDCGRAYLADRMTTIAGGTTQIIKNVLGERVLGLPKG